MDNNIVTIVGRPNVGKSTLFNYISGNKISIVDNKPGVTRDRIIANCTWLNYKFKLIDTGVLEFNNNDIIVLQMQEQIDIAIKISKVLIFVVDGKVGITNQDREVALILRKYKKPIILCINKIDDYNKQINDIYEFYELGF